MRSLMAGASRIALAAFATLSICIHAFAGGPVDRVTAGQDLSDDATDQIIIKRSRKTDSGSRKKEWSRDTL